MKRQFQLEFHRHTPCVNTTVNQEKVCVTVMTFGCVDSLIVSTLLEAAGNQTLAICPCASKFTNMTLTYGRAINRCRYEH